MHTAAIAAVVSFIPPITPFSGLIALFFIFSALGDIKTINYQLFDFIFYFYHMLSLRTIWYQNLLVVKPKTCLCIKIVLSKFTVFSNMTIITFFDLDKDNREF